MESSLQTTVNSNLPQEEITTEKIRTYLKAFGLASNLTENEQTQFIEIAKAYQLNPFKREIYCVKYFKNVQDEKGNWHKEPALSIVTGYEVYLKRAARVHVLDGWEARTEGSGKDAKAVVTIYRKDWSHPFVHECYFVEYNQNNKMWKEKPATMIKKVATAQAFRLCFPEFGGLPYTNDELPDEMSNQDFEKLPEPKNDVLTEEQKTALRCDYEQANVKDAIIKITRLDKLKEFSETLVRYKAILTEHEYTEIKALIVEHGNFIIEAMKAERLAS